MPEKRDFRPATYEKIIKLLAKSSVWITRLTPLVVFLA
jgi:hypothetical protein